MKKYAFIMMGDDLNPEQHRAQFKTDSTINYILTVRNKQEAVEKIKELRDEGVGVVELCGAFGRDFAREIIKETNNEIGIAYIVNEPEQEEMIENFFAGK